MDTDGVYFQPPESISDEDAETAYIETIGSALPEGIRLAHDGRYRAMISLKMKNYVLETYGGHLIFKGSALRSRADERFGVEFIQKAAHLLLKRETQQIGDLYLETARAINEHKPESRSLGREGSQKDLRQTSKKRVQGGRDAKAGTTFGYQRSRGEGPDRDYDHDEDTHYCWTSSTSLPSGSKML